MAFAFYLITELIITNSRPESVDKDIAVCGSKYNPEMKKKHFSLYNISKSSE